jgi:Holliday junction resolvase RusA-like endonuclease
MDKNRKKMKLQQIAERGARKTRKRGIDNLLK